MLTDRKKRYTLLLGDLSNVMKGQGKRPDRGRILIMEGRPQMTGLKETCRTLLRKHVTPTVITDSMAGFFFYQDLVKEVCLAYYAQGQDGVLSPVGGLLLGILAKRHRVPLDCYPSASQTKLMGTEKDVSHFNSYRVAPRGINGYVPLTEWVPRQYVRKTYA